MERHRRFVLLAAAILLAAALYYKGHRPSREGRNVAFLPYSSPAIRVRVTGSIGPAGVYALPVGATTSNVILLTSPDPAAGTSGREPADIRLQDGDIVQLAANGEQVRVVNVQRMKAGEAILLGIRLDPDRMDADDWRSIPGIGPKLANTIVAYRQYNGGFHTVEALRMVPGVGPKKYSLLSKYFREDKAPILKAKK